MQQVEETAPAAEEERRPTRRAPPPPNEPVNALGIAILSAASLVVISLAVEGVLGWLRSVRKERRRRGKSGAFISPAASSEALAKLLKRGGEGHAARGLPEGEYFSPRRDAGSRGSSAPPSPGRLTPSNSGTGEFMKTGQQCVPTSPVEGVEAAHTRAPTHSPSHVSQAAHYPVRRGAEPLAGALRQRLGGGGCGGRAVDEDGALGKPVESQSGGCGVSASEALSTRMRN